MTSRELQALHRKCEDSRCVVTRRLEEVGANLQWGKGRHCEIAAVAATGKDGMTDGEAVAGRRSYAKHLGVDLRDGNLSGGVSDPDHAIHVMHAIQNFRGAPGAVHPINLGSARVLLLGDRYIVQIP